MEERKYAIALIITMVLDINKIGYAIAFYALLVSQTVETSEYSGYGLSWYFAFFYFAWIGCLLATLGTKTLNVYRHLLLSMTSVVLAFIPINIDSCLKKTAADEILPFINGMRVAGLIVMAFPATAIWFFLGYDLQQQHYSPQGRSNLENAARDENADAFLPRRDSDQDRDLSMGQLYREPIGYAPVISRNEVPQHPKRNDVPLNSHDATKNFSSTEE